jgi:hypothetical protein
VSWDARKPGTLKYTGAGGETELSVVQRSIELPSEKGWGGNELISLTVSIVLERERERKRQDRDRREREERQRGKRERERREREERDFLGGARLSRKKKSRVFNYKHPYQLISTTNKTTTNKTQKNEKK